MTSALLTHILVFFVDVIVSSFVALLLVEPLSLAISVTHIIRRKEKKEFILKALFILALVILIALIIFPNIFNYRFKIDALTWLTIVSLPLLIFDFYLEYKQKKNKKKKPFFIALSIFIGIFWLTVCYGAFIESQRIIIVEQKVDLGKDYSPQLQNKKFLTISDTHVGPIKGEDFLRKTVEKLNEFAKEPENIDKELYLFMEGDFIDSKITEAKMLEPFKDLNDRYNTFAVLGNHDFSIEEPDDNVILGTRFVIAEDDYEQKSVANEIESVLEKAGVNVLRNEQVIVEDGQNKIIIGGIDDIWSSSTDLNSTMSGALESDFFILLSHNPDTLIELEKAGLSQKADFVFVGHTHGGEIRIPITSKNDSNGLPLIPLATKLGNHYDKGLFIYDNVPFFITSGTGESTSKIRLFNPPEIAVIEFTD